MIYLIGGAPKTGKTTLAKMLSKNYSIPWVSVDTLECVVLAYIDKAEHDKKFPARAQRSKSNDEKYSKYSTKEIIDAYIKQGETSYDAIEMFALSEITDDHDFLIEGYQITPELANKLVVQYGKENIKAVFLSKTDRKMLIENFKQGTASSNWTLTRTNNEGVTFPKIAEMISAYSQYFQKESRKYELEVFDMDTDFNEQLDKVAEFLWK